MANENWVLASFLIAATLKAYALSPQEQALRIVGLGANSHPVVVRINTSGRYETVLTKGGSMEGSPVTEPILFERFSFGWQPLASLYYECDIAGFHLSRIVTATLMRGMPRPKDDRPCTHANTILGDAGPVADVEAVRKQMRGPLVPYVVVSGDWAKGDWYGAGGGEDFFRKINTSWKFVRGGGGAYGTDDMRELGVPKSAWCALRISNATCPPSK